MEKTKKSASYEEGLNGDIYFDELVDVVARTFPSQVCQ
jgi:hypothetical protein